MSREDLGRKYPILIAPYDPAWPDLFEREAARLRALLPADLMGPIEHIGSTAVPGLAAKPVIDMLAGLSSFDEAERRIRPALEDDGYTHIWRADEPPGHMMFVKGYGPDGYLPGVRIFHLHAAPAGHPIWERLLFRDHLRSHPEAAAAYEALKRRLAALHVNDREAYTEGKTDFIAAIMDEARRGSRKRPSGRSRG